MRALIRGLPASFASATAAEAPTSPIDVPLARRQHAAYARALADAGLEVRSIPADDAFPDCVFVEDTVVVAGGRALITAPGLPSRRGEGEAVAAALEPWLEVVRAPASARLDGGDVLRVGMTLYVGISGRSDAGGEAALRAAFGPLGYRVQPVEVPGALHLKCVCSSLGPGAVLLAEGTADPALFQDDAVRLLMTPAEDAYAANVVRAGDRVLAPAGFPRTHALLRAAGYDVVVLENSELRKADGSLTCCSVLF